MKRFLLGLAMVAAATGCDLSAEPADEGRRLSDAGLELTVPAAWDARLYLTNDVTPVIEAASFPLPPAGADVPDDPPAAAFGDEGVYLALISMGDFRYGGPPMPSRVRWETPSRPLTVTTSDFDRASGRPVATRHVIVDGRAFLVRVVLASEDLLPAANDVLTTLAVSAWKPDECPSNWPGPWTACPEAAWVRLVAETAGYRITDETGSALVAEGRGDGFYIQAGPMSEKHFVATARRQAWSRRGRVEGIEVFGDDLRQWWRAQGFVFRLTAGPSAEATLPSVGELPGLVRASLEVPPPH